MNMKKVDKQNGKEKKSYLILHRLKFACYITDYILTFFPKIIIKYFKKLFSLFINLNIYKNK